MILLVVILTALILVPIYLAARYHEGRLVDDAARREATNLALRRHEDQILNLALRVETLERGTGSFRPPTGAAM